jgi:hypothetical protein
VRKNEHRGRGKLLGQREIGARGKGGRIGMMKINV